MPRYNDIINNFINGEISPKLYGRSDSEIYKRSCRTLKNMIVHPQGGASRRSGTEFVMDRYWGLTMAKQAFGTGTRIIPFEYGEDESYLLIFNPDQTDDYNFAMFYNINDGQMGHIYMNGGSAAGWPYDSVGAGEVSSNTFADADQIADMQYAQNGRVMFFAHPAMVPFQIVRSGRNSFQGYDFYRPADGTGFLGGAQGADRLCFAWPFLDLNTSTTTVTNSATTGTITLTASAALFSADMVGTPFCISNSGTVGVAFITVFTTSTLVTAEVERTMPASAAYTTWQMSAWSKAYGYPKCVTFFQGRAVWASTTTFPEKIWFSQAYDLYELSNTRVLNSGTAIVSSDPGSLQALSTSINEITWMAGGVRNLLVGTRGREYAIGVLSGSAAEIDIKPQTSYGSEDIQPAIVEDTPVFVQRGFRKLREMVFDYRTEGYGAAELTFFAEHYPRASQEILGDASISKFKAMTYQALDNSILWAIDTNGYLYGCTKSRENTVTAFHRHELGGLYNDEFPRVLSIASVKNGTSDELFMIVRRTVAGSSAVYLERLTKPFYGTTLHNDLGTRENQPYFLDCAKIYRPTTSAFWARLRSSGTADYAAGSTTATTTGTIGYTNKVALSGAITSYVDWDGTSNASAAIQTGCVRFSIVLDRSAVVATATLINICQAAGSTNNQIKIDLTSTRNVILTIRDSTGVAIVNGVTVGNLTNTEYIYYYNRPIVFELNYDLDVGRIRLFINGKQLGSTLTDTGTRSSAIDLIRINGDATGAQSRASIGYSEVVLFDTVQHVEDHELFDYVSPSVTFKTMDEYGTVASSVGVLADGLYLGKYTPNGTSITLPDDEYTTVITGFPYTHLVETQPIDAGTGIGSAQGSVKRIDRAVVRFNASAAASIGPSEAEAEDVVFRTDTTPAADPITLVTDDKIIDFPGDYDRQARIVVTSEDPLPCNVTCIVVRGVTADV